MKAGDVFKTNDGYILVGDVNELGGTTDEMAFEGTAEYIGNILTDPEVIELIREQKGIGESNG